jgi:DNA-binding transcriptional ArsR family regulator
MVDDSRAPRLVFSRSGADRQHADQRAVAALGALGQSSRLAIFRLLIRHEPKGLAVGAIAERVGAPQNTVSAHLAILARAELVRSTRQSRSVHYRVDLAGVHWMISYLLADCCGGDPAKCASIETLLHDICCLSKVATRRGRPKL